MGQRSIEALRSALSDRSALARYEAKLRIVAGSLCLWWVGAIAAKGHGRFWLGPAHDGRDAAIIAHRFGYALAYGPDALASAALLAHLCDNPLCQNPEHLESTTNAQNRAQWAIRRHRRGGALRDMRGARGRSREIRDAIKSGGGIEAVVLAGMPPVDAGQLPLSESW